MRGVCDGSKLSNFSKLNSPSNNLRGVYYANANNNFNGLGKLGISRFNLKNIETGANQIRLRKNNSLQRLKTNNDAQV